MMVVVMSEEILVVGCLVVLFGVFEYWVMVEEVFVEWWFVDGVMFGVLVFVLFVDFDCCDIL